MTLSLVYKKLLDVSNQIQNCIIPRKYFLIFLSWVSNLPVYTLLLPISYWTLDIIGDVYQRHIGVISTLTHRENVWSAFV